MNQPTSPSHQPSTVSTYTEHAPPTTVMWCVQTVQGASLTRSDRGTAHSLIVTLRVSPESGVTSSSVFLPSLRSTALNLL